MAKRSVNFINLEEGISFLLDTNDKITPEVKFHYKKSSTASRLFYADIITHSFKLDKKYNSPEELTLAVEMKMYEDLALDMQKEYKISFIQKETEFDNVLLIEAFAYDKNAIQEKYASSFKKIKHLDFLTIPILAFETLYTNKQVEKHNDVFLYIGEEEAFLVFYKDGSYISSKKLKSLKEMIQDLDAKNLYPSMEELKNILKTKGVLKENYTLFEYNLFEYIHGTFEHIFTTIKNLALHNRNIYNFTKLDNIYIHIPDTMMPSLPVMVQEYLDETNIYPLNPYSKYTDFDFLDILTAHFIQDKIEENDYSANLTFYKKKTPFFQTYTGKFAISTAAGILFTAAYPAYQQYLIYHTEQENTKLQTKLETLKIRSSRLQKKYKSIKKEIADYTEEEKEINEKFTRLRDIADTLLNMKASDEKYTTMLVTINQLLQKYGLTVDKLTQSGNHMIDLELYSGENRRDTIALFMRDLLERGFSKVSSNEITLNEDAYKSVITIKR